MDRCCARCTVMALMPSWVPAARSDRPSRTVSRRAPSGQQAVARPAPAPASLCLETGMPEQPADRATTLRSHQQGRGQGCGGPGGRCLSRTHGGRRALAAPDRAGDGAARPGCSGAGTAQPARPHGSEEQSAPGPHGPPGVDRPAQPAGTADGRQRKRWHQPGAGAAAPGHHEPAGLEPSAGGTGKRGKTPLGTAQNHTPSGRAAVPRQGRPAGAPGPILEVAPGLAGGSGGCAAALMAIHDLGRQSSQPWQLRRCQGPCAVAWPCQMSSEMETKPPFLRRAAELPAPNRGVARAARTNAP
jgi:hypothetical protein